MLPFGSLQTKPSELFIAAVAPSVGCLYEHAQGSNSESDRTPRLAVSASRKGTAPFHCTTRVVWAFGFDTSSVFFPLHGLGTLHPQAPLGRDGPSSFFCNPLPLGFSGRKVCFLSGLR